MEHVPADVTAEIHGYSHPDATPTPWEVGCEQVAGGGFAHHDAGGRALVFRVRPVRGLGFCKGATFSQTTWRFPG
jgi:hypothetical protein